MITEEQEALQQLEEAISLLQEGATLYTWHRRAIKWREKTEDFLNRLASGAGIGQVRSIRTVPVQMPAPMPAEELQRAFSQVREETPLWRAVHHLLAEDIVAAMNTTCDKRAANRPGDMAHAAGGLSWLLDFRDRLYQEQHKAQRVQPEAREEA